MTFQNFWGIMQIFYSQKIVTAKEPYGAIEAVFRDNFATLVMTIN